MIRFSPTITIAVDPYAMALIETARQELLRELPDAKYLLRTCGLLHCEEAKELLLSEDIPERNLDFADKDYSLSWQQAGQLFEENRDNLQNQAISLLRKSRDLTAITLAEQAGLSIGKQYRVFIIASAACPASRLLAPQIAQLLCFLLEQFFTGEPARLELIALMPSLFDNADTNAYAQTYAFLKKLEWDFEYRLRQNKPVVFSNHWLIDRTNAASLQLPSLHENLTSYGESLALFWLRELEASSISIVNPWIGNKVAIFSGFGVGELIFPAQQVTSRLSIDLALNILSKGYLIVYDNTEENYRRLLLDCKAFILQKEFDEAFETLAQPQGMRIWQDFLPLIPAINSPETVKTVISSLRDKAKAFREKDLLEFKRNAEKASGLAEQEIQVLLNREIIRQVDEYASGIDRVQKFLRILLEPAIVGDADLVGEQPSNLIVHGRKLASAMDGILKVEANRSQSEACLQKIVLLRAECKIIEKHIETERHDPESVDDELSPEAKLIQKHNELSITFQELQKVLIEEDTSLQNQRLEAIKELGKSLDGEIATAESNVLAKVRSWEDTLDRLSEALAEQRLHLIRIALFIAGCFLCFIFTISLPLSFRTGAWILWGGIGGLFLALPSMKYIINFNNVSRLKRQLIQCKRSTQAAAITLRDAHNKLLSFEFDLYIQRLKEALSNKFIFFVRQRLNSIEETAVALQKLREDILRQRSLIEISSSSVRRSAVTDDDITALYREICPDAEADVLTFTSTKITRSDVLKISLTEFRSVLEISSREKFAYLERYSLGDILGGHSGLKLEAGSNNILQQLYNISQPAVRLFHHDMDRLGTGAKDFTLWCSTKDADPLVERYKSLCASLQIIASNLQHQFTLLCRHIGFPAYFLSAAQFYRECYERMSNSIESENREIDDLFPIEELYEVWEIVLLALALSVLSYEGEAYYFREYSLGDSRRDIVRRLTQEYALQNILEQIQGITNELLLEATNEIAEKLITLGQRQDWEPFDNRERKLLDSLLQKFNPLS